GFASRRTASDGKGLTGCQEGQQLPRLNIAREWRAAEFPLELDARWMRRILRLDVRRGLRRARSGGHIEIDIAPNEAYCRAMGFQAQQFDPSRSTILRVPKAPVAQPV